MTPATIHSIADRKRRPGLTQDERHYATRFVLLLRRAPKIASAFLSAIEQCLSSQWLAGGGRATDEDQREVLRGLAAGAATFEHNAVTEDERRLLERYRAIHPEARRFIFETVFRALDV